MNVHCNKCLADATPVKANKNPFSLEAKCRNCGADIDLSDSKIMLNVGRVFRIPCYIVMAYVIIAVSKHLPQNFEEFIYTFGFIVVIAAIVFAVYCIVGNVVLFLIKSK